MRNTLAAAIKVHTDLSYGWHYQVLGSTSDVSSLSNYLTVNDEIFAKILTICGVAVHSITNRGKRYLKLLTVMDRSKSAYSWNQFLVEHHLEGTYFDKMQVKGATDGQVY